MAKNCKRTSGYILHMADCFTKAKLENIIPRSERMKSCALIWKQMRPDDKTKYKEKANVIKAACVVNGQAAVK
jgi:hypothetical protein